MIKVLIITGNQLRHKYYVTEIAKQLDVVGVIFEEKIKQENKFKNDTSKYKIVNQHFNNRNYSERKYFSGKIDIESLHALYVKTGESNSSDTFEWVKEKRPEYLLLFGSSIIKDPLLGLFGKKVINLHLGLSPYYRGAGTNFWPLVNGEPECVGATIHLATLKVDAGSILKQIRPKIGMRDGPHDIGNKTIIAAIEQIPEVVLKYDKRIICPRGQDLTLGKVYKRKDLTSEAIIKLNENFDKGMIVYFFNKKEERLKKYPIID